MDAARLLNITDEGFARALDRVSNIEQSAIDNNIFRPYTLSLEVQQAMAENAAKIGLPNPYDIAAGAIADLQGQFSELNLTLPEFPLFANPLQPIMQDTPLGPTTLNLPGVNADLVANQVQGGNFNNLTTQQKLALLFPND